MKRKIMTGRQDAVLTLLSVTSLLLLTAAAVYGIFRLLVQSGVTEVPSAVSWLFGVPSETEEAETESAEDAIFTMLRAPESGEEDTGEFVRVSRDDFSTVLAALAEQRSEEPFACDAQVIYSSGSVQGTFLVSVQWDGDNWKTEVTDPNGVKTVTRARGDIVTVTTSNGKTAELPLGDFTCEGTAGIPTVQDALTAPEEDITRISYTTRDGKMYVYLLLHSEDSSLWEEYLISTDTAFVSRCVTYKGNPTVDAVAIYNCTVRSARVLSDEERAQLG